MRIIDALKRMDDGCFADIGVFYKNKKLVYYNNSWHVFQLKKWKIDIEILHTDSEQKAVEKLIEGWDSK